MNMNVTLRWRAAVLAAIAAVSLALTGCNDEPAVEEPGIEEEDNGGY